MAKTQTHIRTQLRGRAHAPLTLNRRRFLQVGAGTLAALGMSAPRFGRAQTDAQTDAQAVQPLPAYAEDLGRYPFELPELGYAYNALEPVIDAETMNLHYDGHHQSYVDNLNEALADLPELQGRTLGELLTTLPELPGDLQSEVQNQGGGHLNHALWWRWVAPGGSGEPVGGSAALIEGTFGGLEAFKERFNAAADTRFGSGWAWLVIGADGQLSVLSTPNQDNPISRGQVPLLGLDVWEHAYYLSYRNRRPEYIGAFWEVVNWDAVEEQYGAAAELFGL